MSTPKTNIAYEFTMALLDTATQGAFKANPTIAAGDFQVSTDNGAYGNLATLPTIEPAGSINVRIQLSASEMNGGKITIQAIDAAGDEWDDALVFIDATVVTIDEIVRSTTPTNKLDINATGNVGIDFGNITGILGKDNVSWVDDSEHVGLNLVDTSGVLGNDSVSWVDANDRVNVGQWIDTAVTISATSNKPEVDLFSISDEALPADNLQLQYNTTGLTGLTFPSFQDQLDNFAAGGGAPNTVAESRVLTTGLETNTFTNTHTLDGTTHDIADDGGVIDFYYQFDVTTTGTPTSIIWTGYAQSNGDSYNVFGWNWAGTSWDQIGTINGKNGTATVEEIFLMTTAHVGTGGDEGKVRFRIQSTTGTEIFSDRVLCSFASALTVGEITNDLDANSAQLALIVADTDELQQDDIPGLISALNDVSISGIWDELTSSHVRVGGFGVAIKDILADTNELQLDDVPLLINNLNDISISGIWDELTASHVRVGGFGVAITDMLSDTNELQLDNIPGLISSLNNLSETNVISALEDAGLVIHITTIDVVTTQTQFTIVDGPPDNSSLTGSTIVIEDATTSLQKSVSNVHNYIQVSKTVSLGVDPRFTVAPGDKVRFLPNTPSIPEFEAGGSQGLPVVGNQIPNAFFDAAGGLLISGAGGLDMDAKLANTNEITVARMEALNDWIDGERLDLIIDSILADTNGLQSDDIPTLISNLNNISTAQVNAEADQALTDFFGSASGLVDEVWNELTSEHVTVGSFAVAVTDMLADTNELQADWTDTGRLDTILDLILADTNELQGDNVPTLISNLNNISISQVNTEIDTGLTDFFGTASGLVDEIWNELSAGHLAAGSYGVAVTDILADTNELQADWTNDGRLDTILDTILEDTNEIQSNDLATLINNLNNVSISEVNTEVDTALIDFFGTASGLVDEIWNELTSGHVAVGSFAAAITDTLADTDELQGDWTDSGRLDTILDSILEDTSELQGDSILTAITNLNDISVNDVWNELTVGHVTNGSFGVAITDILADTNEMQLDDIPGLISSLNDLSQAEVTGGGYTLNTDVNGSVRIVDGIGIGEIDTLSGAIVQVNQLGTQAKADVNAEVVDVMDTDLVTLPGQSTPPSSPTRTQIYAHLYKAWLNKSDQTEVLQQMYDAAGSTVDQKRIVGEDGGIVTIGTVVSGP